MQNMQNLKKTISALRAAGWILDRRREASPGRDGLLDLCAVEPRPGWAMSKRGQLERGALQCGRV